MIVKLHISPFSLLKHAEIVHTASGLAAQSRLLWRWNIEQRFRLSAGLRQTQAVLTVLNEIPRGLL